MRSLGLQGKHRLRRAVGHALPLLLLHALLVAPAARGQQAPSALSELSLEEILSLPVAVAASRARSVRESPGVLTVVTREELASSGARDLLDVLMTVPGFAPGVDVQNVVDVGVRGNWGHEGKVLLLLDGQEMNENLYSTLQLGNHYPIDQIERIEIIRGPGSVQYGGNAELAVISVITRGAEQLEGAAATVRYGQGRGDFGRRDVSISAGHIFPQLGGLSASISGFAGESNRGQGVYRDVSGATQEMRGNYRLDPAYLNGAVAWKDLKLRFILDDYRVTSGDGNGAIVPSPDHQDFLSLHLDAQGEFHPVPRLTLTPRLNYKRQQPWRIQEASSFEYYDKIDERYTGRLTAAYEATDHLNFQAGAEAFSETARLAPGAQATGYNTPFGPDGARSVNYTDGAGFAEVDFSSILGNLVGGLRAEKHSGTGFSVVPRLALTKVLGDFHFKLLFAKAFRAPGVENINGAFNNDIRPERTTAFEAEAGYQFNEAVYAVVNAFDTTIQQTIVYGLDPTGAESYGNKGRTGTRGLEAVVHAQAGKHRVTVSYSFYTSAGNNQVDAYAVPANSNLQLGMPAHKIALGGEVHAAGLIIAPSTTFISERYAFTSQDAAGAPLQSRLDPQLLANLFVSKRDFLVPKLELGIGVYNLFDVTTLYPQPYNPGANLHAPLPGPRREGLVRLSYAVGL